MRIFHIHSRVANCGADRPARPGTGALCGWPAHVPPSRNSGSPCQAALQQLAGMQLVDLHVSDLLNAQLPSHYDYTSQYDLLVFRRLATRAPPEQPLTGIARRTSPAHPAAKRSGPLVLRRIDTSPVVCGVRPAAADRAPVAGAGCLRGATPAAGRCARTDHARGKAACPRRQPYSRACPPARPT